MIYQQLQQAHHIRYPLCRLVQQAMSLLPPFVQSHLPTRNRVLATQSRVAVILGDVKARNYSPGCRAASTPGGANPYAPYRSSSRSCVRFAEVGYVSVLGKEQWIPPRLCLARIWAAVGNGLSPLWQRGMGRAMNYTASGRSEFHRDGAVGMMWSIY